MITVNGVQLRNLEEQVLKNKEDIAKHYQATNLPLNLAGIKVVGSITDVSELPPKETYQGEYGDAYVEVIDDDTVLWIWTRPNPDAGEDTNYWLDIPFTTVGPRGEKGEQGEKGDTGLRGSRWFSGTGQPSTTSGYQVYDYYINVATGNIWHLHEAVSVGGNPYWVMEGNIKGPQGAKGDTGATGSRGETGPRGEQGVPGPAGPVVDLAGYITSVDQLPTPSSVSPQTGYLQVIDGVTHVWIIIGGVWTDAGIFGGGTIVTVGGSIQNEWDADTKLDKILGSTVYRVYGVNASGNQTSFILRPDAQTTSTSYKYQPVIYDITSGKSVNNGLIRIAENPLEPYHTASKRYVDDKTELYRHDIHVIADVYGDTCDFRFSMYGHQATPYSSGNIPSFTTAASGVMTLSAEKYIVYFADLQLISSGLTVYGLGLDGYEMQQSFDGGTIEVYDTVTAAI